MNNEQLKYLEHKDIDYKKWDKCIENASNEIIYAYSWYLNLTCSTWDALILDDYQYIMPIPIKKKFFFTYVSQPYFAQQLGIFPCPAEEIQLLFLNQLSKKFKKVNYQLNWQMESNLNLSFKQTQRVNLILPLNDNYNNIYNKFTKNTKRNISRHEQNDVKILRHLSIGDYFNSFESRYKITESTKKQLRHIMQTAQKRKIGEIYGAITDSGTLSGAIFFIRSKNRVILLNSFSTEVGRQNRSMFALVNEFIKHNASSTITLDFEGSMNKGLARFYKGFGASNQNYNSITLNKLPFLSKIKKWLVWN